MEVDSAKVPNFREESKKIGEVPLYKKILPNKTIFIQEKHSQKWKKENEPTSTEIWLGVEQSDMPVCLQKTVW